LFAPSAGARIQSSPVHSEGAQPLSRAILKVLEAPHGHDSFLIEQEAPSDLIAVWRTEQGAAQAANAPQKPL
jgi:homoserine acetyltransferase